MSAYQTPITGFQFIGDLEDDQHDQDCPHDDVWFESGSCMLCEPAWATGEEAESYRDQNPDVYGRNPL